MSGNVTGTRRRVIHERAASNGCAVLDEIVREIRADSDSLSALDHGFLSDVCRGRYSLAAGLPRLLDIASRCRSDRGRYAIGEVLTAAVAIRCAQGTLPLEVAVVNETRLEFEVNADVHSYLLHRAPVSAVAAARKAFAQARALIELGKSLLARRIA